MPLLSRNIIRNLMVCGNKIFFMHINVWLTLRNKCSTLKSICYIFEFVIDIYLTLN